MEHKEAYELIDAYVFGTLSDAEHQAVEEHLQTKCALCHARLREVGDVSLYLAQGLIESSPSAGLKVSLMQQVSKTTVISKTSDDSTSSSISPTETSSAWLKWSKALTMTGAVAVVVLAFWNVTLNSKISNLQDELANSSIKLNRLAADNSIQNDATILLGKPCTRLVDLAGVEPNPQAFAKLFLHPDEDFGVFYAYKLPDVPEGREYQAWIKHDSVTQSVGVFTVQNDGYALLKFRGLPTVASIDSFMVTIEPIGGVKEPTGMRYLLGYNTLSKVH
ncbi:anti-sigma factor [bacterium AH-315-J21]|nr:anti-sigma factor [bacterium AH-315-J21]